GLFTRVAVAREIDDHLHAERRERLEVVPFRLRAAIVVLVDLSEVVYVNASSQRRRGAERHRHREPGHTGTQPTWTRPHALPPQDDEATAKDVPIVNASFAMQGVVGLAR